MNLTYYEKRLDYVFVNERVLGQTKLTSAVILEDFELCKFLIINGAFINVYNQCGRTALHYSIIKKNYGIVDLLINSGASVNQGTISGFCALKQKSMCKSCSKSCYGLENQINDNDHKEGFTPLYYSIRNGSPEITELLLKKGANPDIKIPLHNLSLLEVSILSGDRSCFGLLVKYKANLNKFDENGETVLMKLVRSKENINNIKFYLKEMLTGNIDINCTSKKAENMTPLMIAAHSGKFQILKTLIKNGANLFLTNQNGETAFDIAVKKNRNDIASFLKTKL